MKYKYLLLSLLILSVLVSPASAMTNVTACGTISGENILVNDISDYAGGNCIIMNANSLLDCQGIYKIDGIENDDGIRVTGNNVTIKNCLITDWSNGIRVYGNGTLVEDSFIGHCSNAVFTSNVGSTEAGFFGVYDNVTFSEGVIRIVSEYNEIKNSNIRSQITFASASDFDGDNNYVHDNIFNFSSTTPYAIYIDSDRVNETFTRNTFNLGKIYLNSNTPITIYDNIINGTGAGTVIPPTTFNVTVQAGTRITTSGDLGGNFWIGTSESCIDADTDGFCDSEVTFGTFNVKDYHPYSDEYCETAFSLNLTENLCYNATDYRINTTYYDSNECWAYPYISNYTFSNLVYNYSHTVYSCENSTTNKTTQYYNDTLGCGYNTTVVTYANCPSLYGCQGAGVCTYTGYCGDNICQTTEGETAENCCFDCCGQTGQTLTAIGEGAGNMIDGLGNPISVLLILTSIIFGISIIFKNIVNRIKEN